MKKRILIFGTISMALAVVLGAVGSHVIQSYITEKQLNSFNVGAKYHIYHSLALLVLTSLSYRINSTFFYISCNLIIGGIILFSGSLYLISVVDLFHLQALKSLFIPATPIGGLLFISGWIFATIGIVKGKTKNSSST